jgi:SAM-dependent methyltransferase
MSNKETVFLKNHLNVSWLRPENALWDAIASSIISRYAINSPSLDLGCGNGIFSFITAGGSFSIDYDWYINVDVEGFWKNKDIYNACKVNSLQKHIVENPRYRFTYGLDQKINLLKQAESLGLYENIIQHDANQKLPFNDSQLRTVFSNILYWLNNPTKSLKEIHRILQKGGRALLCIPDTKFKEYCLTYSWKEKNSPLLRKLNLGRSETMKWSITYEEFLRLAQNIGFSLLYHSYYLSNLTLMLWDIGLRPISPYLIKMANKLSLEDRRSIKLEWIETMLELLSPIYEKEIKSREEGGFHFFILEKQ